MAIEKIEFRVCEACGARVRAGAKVVGFRILCSACSAEEARKAQAKAQMVVGADVLRDRTLTRPRASVLPPASSEGAETAKLSAGAEMRMKRVEVAGTRSGDSQGSKISISRWTWFGIGFSVFLCVMAAAAVGIWRLRQIGAPPLVEKERILAPWERPVPQDDPLLTVLPGFEESITVAGKFLEARDAESLAPWIRDSQDTKEIVREYFPTCRLGKRAKERLSQLPPVVEGKIAYQCFGFVDEAGLGRMVAVVPTKEGPKVDFKAFVEWSDVPFEDLFGGKVKQASELRLMLRMSTYYNFQFAEQAAYTAYEAASAKDSGSTVTLYVRRGSEIEERLSWAIERIGLHPATVAVEAVNGSEKHRQYMITRLRALGFVVPDGQ